MTLLRLKEKTKKMVKNFVNESFLLSVLFLFSMNAVKKIIISGNHMQNNGNIFYFK